MEEARCIIQVTSPKVAVSQDASPKPSQVDKGSPATRGSTSPTSRRACRLPVNENRSSILRKSLGSATTNIAAGSPDVVSNGLAYEMTRLRDKARTQAREAEAQAAEATTLRAALAAKSRALARAVGENEALTQRALKAEGGLQTSARALAVCEGERSKARAEAAAVGRIADKLAAQLAAAPKGTGFSEAIATLEAEARGLRSANASLSEDAKASAALIRAKDKELAAVAVRDAHAMHVSIENGELRNSLADLQRRLEEGAAARATLAAEKRRAEGDADAARSEAAMARAAAVDTKRQLAATGVQLAAAEERNAALEGELAAVRGELARVGAVAARATAREVAGGAKVDGVVPVTRHLEEVRYLQGEAERLRAKLAVAKRSNAAMHSQKDLLHKKLDAQVAGQKAKGAQSPSHGAAAELAALKARLTERDAQVTALQQQVERAGPRIAASRAAAHRSEREVAALAAQLAAVRVLPRTPASASPPRARLVTPGSRAHPSPSPPPPATTAAAPVDTGAGVGEGPEPADGRWEGTATANGLSGI